MLTTDLLLRRRMMMEGRSPLPPPPDMSRTPLTFEAKEDDTPISAISFEGDKTLLYSLDNGTTWQSATIGEAPATLATLNAGETIQFKGDNFCPGGMIAAADMSGGEDVSKPFYAYGNMLSLLSAEDYENLDEVPVAAFEQFFAGTLVDIKPDHLLLLPATTLAGGCYSEMFSGCTSLTSSPELPATTLAQSCYGSMFSGCTSLTSSPELPATTLVDNCYSNMFEGCTNLSEVKCYAEDISAMYCTSQWLYGVAASGTFYRSANSSGWQRDHPSGIPQGWTVIPPISGPQ